MIEHLSAITIRRKDAGVTLPPTETLDTVLARAALLAAPAMAIATCERFEVYTTSPIASALSLLPDVSTELVGEHAATHLFRVAAGLDSRLVGEPHVLGQVRRAAALSETVGLLSTELRTLVDRALRTGRKARSAAGLDRIASSYADLAVAAAGGVSRVAIVGTGALAEEIARKLPATDRIIIGRHVDRTRTLADRLGTRWSTLDTLTSALADAEAVIAATGASRVLVRGEHLALTRQGVRLIDVSASPNIDPKIPGVLDLDALAERSSLHAHPAVASAERIVRSELAAFDLWLAQRRAHAGAIA